MTEEEAKRAAATFEFPPWRAKAHRFSWWGIDGKEDPASITWALAVYDETGEYRLFATPQEWLEFWENPLEWIERLSHSKM